MSKLEIQSLQKSPGTFTIQLSGTLDAQTHGQLQAFLGPLIESNPAALAFDMSGLQYISSAGIRVLIAAAKQLNAGNAKIAVVHLQPQVKKVFDIIAALPRQQIFADIDELDRYLLAIQDRVKNRR